ncbi:MAG: hypothetical protein Q8K22_12345 [Rhodoferax sp.]|nr:hypothetical protein [Rhodoferax sp.]
MPLPLLLVGPAITAALSGVTTSGLLTAAASVLAAATAADGIADWFDSGTAQKLIIEKINTRLSAAGVGLEFPVCNPLTDEGKATIKRTIERYILERINTKTGAEFSSLEDLNQENFLIEVGRLVVAPINAKTGSNLTAIYPLATLQSQLQTEAVRQFANGGRYNAGALFRGNTMAKIRAKIAGKNPALMAEVKAMEEGSYWGPPKDEKHAKRREKGKARQETYRKTHQQMWVKK